MNAPPPVLVADLFPEECRALIGLLDRLTDREWTAPTACAGWSVHDVALHIWGGDVGIISRRRDGWANPAGTAGFDLSQWDQLVAFIDRTNDDWVRATRRISPHMLIDLLRTSGGEIAAHFSAIDPFATGVPVHWARLEPAPVWLDTAREYTERWVHQQHIRDAAGQPGLTGPRYLAPVLAAFVRALPRALADVGMPEGTALHLHITGDAGGDWAAVRTEHDWRLMQGGVATAAATIVIDQETAWRLWTKGLTPAQALPRIHRTGNPALADAVLTMVSIIA
jgi:uncharacterized protein (TIGR03083 family)